MTRKILILTVVISIIAAYPAFSRGGLRARELTRSAIVPQPRLISPVTQDVDLTGKEKLEFEWSPHEGDPLQRDYYDFRLYKGREMLESTLVFKTHTQTNDSSLELKSDMFQNGEVYTWSLRQVYTGSNKSQRSYSSFKVKK